MTTFYTETPKAPRWVSTEAGYWAWHQSETWRRNADWAFCIQQRQDLLREAEQLWASHNQPVIYEINLATEVQDMAA